VRRDLWITRKTLVADKSSLLSSPVRANMCLAEMEPAMKDLDGIERALLATVYLSVLVLVAAVMATTVS
jgi:hypothetical protein